MVAFDIGDTLILISKGLKKTMASNVEFDFLKNMKPNLTILSYERAIKRAKQRLEKMLPAEKYKPEMQSYILQEELGIKADWKIAKETANEFFKEQQKHTFLVEGVKDTLKELKNNGLALGIISNSGYEKAMRWLTFFGIKEYFTIITISSQLTTEKSGLEPFKDYLQKAQKKGFNAEEILMVGNDLNEDTSAKKLGIKVAILKPTIEKKKVFDEPDYYLDSLKQLPNLIKIING